MRFSLLSRGWQLKLVGSVALVGTLFTAVGEQVLAQMVPDNTLGAEGSVVTPNVNIQGIPSERIDGGATRGANLFHSFQDFNVGEGRGAYFANPTGIENILTRVTGGNPSNIFGRLGVLGEANLFLLNPNGILFGSNASLDIQGSFVATTAERIQLGDSGYFSAAEPQTSSLLSVSPGALFFSQVANQPTAIINQGNLSTGKHLTLRAGNLDLQGQLLSGGDLTLEAHNTVKVRDSVTTPFLAQSGGNLTIIGNGGIDILALLHPTQTPFVSGGNLSLISDGVISGDARFSSGGSFSLKSVSGGLANFVSYYDPIISALGDVDVAANYSGTSLLVEATGNIRFQGHINITGPDTSTLPGGPDTARLSSGSALILRSGQSTLAYGGVNSGAVPTASNGPVPAGITLDGNVTLQPFNGAGGIVSLLAALGDVRTQAITTNGGTIEISSAGAIVSNGQTLDTTNGGNNGGVIALTAQNNITTGNLYSYSLGAGNGGNITLSSTVGSIDTSTGDLNSASISGNGGEIALTAQNNITTGDLGSFSNGAGNGGKITLLSTHGSIDTSAGTLESISNAGNGGAIALTAQNDITTGYLGSFSRSSNGGAIALTAQNNIRTGYLGSFSIGAGNGGKITLLSTGGSIDTSAGSLDSSSNAGNGGKIAVTAQNNITTGDLVSYSKANGNGGAIALTAQNNITTRTLYSYSEANGNGEYNGGAIALTAQNNITTGSMYSYTNANGNGGNITLGSTGGSIDTSAGRLDSNSLAGNGGAIALTAQNDITTGTLSSNSYNAGNGGNITLLSTGGGIDISTGALNSTSISGNGGNITITTGSLAVTNGAVLNASTFVQGDAGSVSITARDNVSFDNGASVLVRAYGQQGNSGSINIQAEQLTLSSNASLQADVDGNKQGRGGNIYLDVTGAIKLTGGSSGGESTRITLGVLPQGGGSGGDLYIKAGSLVLTDGAIIKASSQGEGNAGNIYIKAGVVDISGSVPSSGLPSGIYTSTDTTSKAGNITVDTQTFRVADGAALSARSKGDGQGGDITVNATSTFEAVNGGQLLTTTFGQGQAGNILVNADRVTVSGTDPTYDNRIAKFPNLDPRVANNIAQSDSSGLFANTNSGSTGKGGSITVNANTLDVANGGKLITTTAGSGPAGDITVNANEIQLTGVTTGLLAETTSTAKAGNLTLQPFGNGQTLRVNFQDGAQISASTAGSGRGGNLLVTAPQAVTISGNGKLSVETSGTEAGGNLNIDTQRLTIQDGAQVSASTTSTNPNGVGGNITVNATQSLDLNQASLLAESNGAAPAGSVTINTPNLTARNGTIATSSEESSGGGITITASKIRLFGDSDITTRVNQGTGGGGNIYLEADSILAFDDSDILAFASDGKGGDITLKTPAFFGENYRPAPRRTDPRTLENNDRVDINATGAVNGVITTPDVSFIQNSLTELPDNQINTDSLLANSCIVRRHQPTRGSFTITGTGGLPQRPGDAQMSTFPTVDIETLPSDSTSSTTNPNRPWQKGDPIVEPQGVYRLPNGKLVLSRECSRIQ